MAKRSGQKWLIFGLVVVGVALMIGMVVLVRWGRISNENSQRLSVTSTAMMAEVNTRSTALADVEEQKIEAENQSQIALAHQLAAQAQLLFAPQDAKQITALLLAIESMRLFPTVDAAQVIYDNKLATSVSHVMHGAGVNFVGFSPDSKYLISMGEHDNTVRVSEVETGKEIARVVHNYGAWSAAVSPDSKYVVSGGGDSTARV